MDNIDKKILDLLQSNARISNADIAREVKLAPSVTLARTQKLKKKDLLQVMQLN